MYVSSEEYKQRATTEINSILQSLSDIDREARKMEEEGGDSGTAYQSLCENAASLFKSIDSLCDEANLDPSEYIAGGNYESYCVGNAAFNY